MKGVGGRINTIFFGKNWWVHLLRGLLLLLLGLIMAFRAQEAIKVILIATGAIFLISGLSTVIIAFRIPDDDIRRWVLMFTGLLLAGVGGVLFFKTNIAEVVIILFIACFAFVSGIFELMIAGMLGGGWRHKAVPALSGALSVIFAILFIVHPDAGLIALAWLLSFYLISNGILLIMTAFVLRRIASGSPMTITVSSRR